MKNFDTDQRLLLLDLPPTIPASLNTLNLDYVADTYHPSHYKLSDLPEKIPIINEKTGSFRRFIKRKTPKDKRRVVSAPPGTLRQKELPKPPGMSRNSFSATPPLSSPQPSPEAPKKSHRPYPATPRSISLINENIPSVLTTPGHNPRNSIIIEEDANLKLEPQPSDTASYSNSIISDYLMPVDYSEPKESKASNLDTFSFVDSLFSVDKAAGRHSVSSTEDMSNQVIEKPPLILPKSRDKSKVRFQDKPSKYKIKPDSLKYCLDLHQEYNETRFPLVPKYSHLNEHHETVQEKHRSFSDFTHFKVHMVDNPLSTSDKQEKHRSFTDFTNFKVRSVSNPTVQPIKKEFTTTTPAKTNLRSFFSRFKTNDNSKQKSLPPLPHQQGHTRQRKYYE